MNATGQTYRIEDAQAAIDIRALTADSRTVAPGSLFAALPGNRHDGRDFIADAAAKGAAAILAPDGTPRGGLDPAIPLLTDPNPRRSLSLMAAAFHGPQPAHIAAVTGTNGKTSVTSFARQIWTRLGHPAASLGTLGIKASLYSETLSLTTPDPVALIREIAKLAVRGTTHLALEASSHGLDQYRVDGVRVTSAAFTNLSRDHLDYHDSMAAYLDAKARLFREVLPAGATAVLNADVPEFDTLAAICRKRDQKILSYGRTGKDLRVIAQTPGRAGQTIEIEMFGARHNIHLPLAGAFQAMNVLAALGLVIAEGADPAEAAAALSHLSGVPGRMELAAQHPAGADIFVDYAHTPGALETALTALRPHTAGRLICVFGAGGDRDRGKRPEMGAVAATFADHVIVTDDNPRSEDPGTIRRDILAACPDAQDIGDRRAAIGAAVAMLRNGDVLLIAGKGHEAGQIVGDRVIPFDDAEVAKAAVAAFEGGP